MKMIFLSVVRPAVHISLAVLFVLHRIKDGAVWHIWFWQLINKEELPACVTVNFAFVEEVHYCAAVDRLLHNTCVMVDERVWGQHLMYNLTSTMCECDRQLYLHTGSNKDISHALFKDGVASLAKLL
jgi:hypothetical protein